MLPGKILKFAVDSGEVMLRCGAETTRVEDTMRRILDKHNYKTVEVFVTPTGIFGSIIDNTDNIYTLVKRISKLEINLEKIALVNNLSRNLVESKIDIDSAIVELQCINKKLPYPDIYKYIASAVSCASFSYIFGGSLQDSGAAFITGFLLYFCITKLSRGSLSGSIRSILGGIIAAFSVLTLAALGLGTNVDMAIIGSIMPMVPGLGITNAVRDIMAGEYISGTSRIVDAFLVAICIATGVGIALGAWFFFGGELQIWL